MIGPLKYLYSINLTFIGLGLIVISNLSFARTQTTLSGIIINAEDYEYSSKKRIAYLNGNVQVVYKTHHISADKAIIHLNTKKVYAEGNVIMTNESTHAEADKIDYNYEDNTGFFYNAFIKSGQVVFEGSVIERKGEKDYIATDAKFTTCETCPAAWSFSGSKIDAELGGYAWISRPVLRIAGLPVFILPGLVVPLKSSRQSGLLVPSYNYSSSGGNAISQSYFWAISRNKDLTLTLKNYEKRGLKTLGEYRYVMSHENRGSINGAYLKDRSFEDVNSENKNLDRWYGSYGHHFSMPNNFIHRIHFARISDLRYPIDFPKEVDANGDPSIKNLMSITKYGSNQYASVEAGMNQNLLKEDPLASNEDAVHKLPEIRYSLTQTRVFDTDLLAKLDMNYVNFTRSGLAYDNIYYEASDSSQTNPIAAKSNDGKFDAGNDIIRTGQRVDVQPTLTYPIQIAKAVDILPKVGFRETQYRFNIDSDDPRFGKSAARRYVQTSLSARTQVSQIFGGGLNNAKTTKYKHEIEPSLTYSTIPWIRRPNHGFFGNNKDTLYSQIDEPVSNSDIKGGNGVQFDYDDRVFDQRIVNYTLASKIVRKRWVDGSPDYRSLMVAKVSQSYDINEARRNDSPQPWLPVEASLELKFDQIDSYTTANYYPYATATNYNTRLRYTGALGDYVEVQYTKISKINADNSIDTASSTENLGLGVGLNMKYLTISGAVDRSLVTNEINSWSYSAFFKPPGNCWGFYFTGTQNVNGDAQYDFNMSFNFGGI